MGRVTLCLYLWVVQVTSEIVELYAIICTGSTVTNRKGDPKVFIRISGQSLMFKGLASTFDCFHIINTRSNLFFLSKLICTKSNITSHSVFILHSLLLYVCLGNLSTKIVVRKTFFMVRIS